MVVGDDAGDSLAGGRGHRFEAWGIPVSGDGPGTARGISDGSAAANSCRVTFSGPSDTVRQRATPGGAPESGLDQSPVEAQLERILESAQGQLMGAGRQAATGELAAGAAHEINNPLFAILGLTEFLLKEAAPGSKAHERLVLIQESGLEIKEIIRALLDFARESPDERHDVALDDVARSTVALVRLTNAHKGVELVESYEDAGALVHASPNQLKQIFLNLIANARQALPDGGTVTVEVRAEGRFAVATVADDGSGIEGDVLGRIFEPFFTTKRTAGGTGLGLFVSRGIAEAHGGALTAQSEAGKGARFTLRVPLCDDEAGA